MDKLLTKKELSITIKKNLKKGEVLFHEDDECKYIGIVEKGEIIIKSTLKSGKEIIYNIITEGMIFGQYLLFNKNNHYLGDVIATCQTKVLLINKSNFIEILRTNKLFLNEYLKIEANNTINLNTKIKLLSFNKADDRLLYYLRINEGKIKYDTITSLANSLGLQRETLSRLITKLIKNKMIIKNNNSIRLHHTNNHK